MKWSLLLYALVPILLFFIWFRKPAGRSTSDPGLPDIKGLKEFDATNPNAPESLRQTFYKAVQAHLSGNLSKAKKGYKKVLRKAPDKRVTQHNLDQLKKR